MIRRLRARWLIYLLMLAGWATRPVRWLITRLYFAWCFNEEDQVLKFVMEFSPPDLRCANPEFIVRYVDQKQRKGFRARLFNTGYGIYEVRLEKESHGSIQRPGVDGSVMSKV